MEEFMKRKILVFALSLSLIMTSVSSIFATDKVGKTYEGKALTKTLTKQYHALGANDYEVKVSVTTDKNGRVTGVIAGHTGDIGLNSSYFANYKTGSKNGIGLEAFKGKTYSEIEKINASDSKQTPYDGVTGATVTSSAVKEAVLNALKDLKDSNSDSIPSNTDRYKDKPVESNESVKVGKISHIYQGEAIGLESLGDSG